MKHPYIIIIAGPNGVGKTTFSREYLRTLEDCADFVNADEIEKSIHDTNDRERKILAGRIALEAIDQLVSKELSFAIESTLSGRTLAERLRAYKRLGYVIVIHFLTVPDPDELTKRIAERVSQGGHNIPIDDQIRRFDRCLRNFRELYKETSDEWTVYDASTDIPRPIERGHSGSSED